MTMTYDDAMAIAHSAESPSVSFEELFYGYIKMQAVVENTPDWMPRTDDTALDAVATTYSNGKPHQWQRALHGAIGLTTEAGEVLDLFKKELYGKNKPLSVSHVREELGDVLFYVVLIMRAYNLDMKQLLAENVKKLANRYIEKMGTHGHSPA